MGLILFIVILFLLFGGGRVLRLPFGLLRWRALRRRLDPGGGHRHTVPVVRWWRYLLSPLTKEKGYA